METRLQSSSSSSGIVKHIKIKLLKHLLKTSYHRKVWPTAGLRCQHRRHPNTSGWFLLDHLGPVWESEPEDGGSATEIYCSTENKVKEKENEVNSVSSYEDLILNRNYSE